MAAELIEDLLDDRGFAVALDMDAQGHAYLYVDSQEGGGSPGFHLPPTEEGLKAAEQIEAALRLWREKATTLMARPPR